MWLVLCDDHDLAAQWAFLGLAERGLAPLELVTSGALAHARRWVHRVTTGGAHVEVTLHDGRTFDSRRVRGALNRLVGVYNAGTFAAAFAPTGALAGPLAAAGTFGARLQPLAHGGQLGRPLRVDERAGHRIESPQAHGRLALRDEHRGHQPRVVRVRAPPLVADGEARTAVLAEHVGIDLEPRVGARDLAVEVLRELLHAAPRAGLQPRALRLADLADPSVLQGRQQPQHQQQRNDGERQWNTRGSRALEHRGRLACAPGRASL